MQAWGSCWTVALWTACWTPTPPPLCTPTDPTTASQGQPPLQSWHHRKDCIVAFPVIRITSHGASCLHARLTGPVCIVAVYTCLLCSTSSAEALACALHLHEHDRGWGVRWGVMETPGLVGTGSVLDSEAWQEVMQHRLPAPRSRPPSILETGATCKPPSCPCTPCLHVAARPCMMITHPLNQLACVLVCDLCWINKHMTWNC